MAALQTSHRHGAAVTPGEPQSREAGVWLVSVKRVDFLRLLIFVESLLMRLQMPRMFEE